MIQKWDKKIETGKCGKWKDLLTEFTLWDEGEMAHYVSIIQKGDSKIGQEDI